MYQLMDERTSEHEVELIDEYIDGYAGGFTAEYSAVNAAQLTEELPGWYAADDADQVVDELLEEVTVADAGEPEVLPRVAHIVADLDEPDDRVERVHRALTLPATRRGDAPAAWYWAMPEVEDMVRRVERPSPPRPHSHAPLVQRFWTLRPTVFARLESGVE